MFRRIREAIVRLFVHSRRRLPRPIRRLDDAALGRHFLEIVERQADDDPGGMARVGEVSILNLDEVRDRIGEKWPQVSHHVHLLIENVLSRHVRGNGFFFQCEEGVYGIVFSPADAVDAEARCGEIQKEIKDYLFGASEQVEPEKADHSEMPFFPLSVGASSFEVDTSALKQAPSPGAALREQVTRRSRQLVQERARGAELQVLISNAEKRFDALAERAKTSGSPVMIRRLNTILDQLRSLERSLQVVTEPTRRVEKRRSAVKMVEIPRESSVQPNHGSSSWSYVAPDSGPMQHLARVIRKAEVHIEEISREPGKASGVPKTVSADIIDWQALPGDNIDYCIDFVPMIELQTSYKGIYSGRLRFRWRGTVYEPRELFRLEGEPEVLLIADRLCLRRFVRMEEPQAPVIPALIATVHQATLESLGSRREYLEVATQVPSDIRRTLLLRIVLDRDWRQQDLGGWFEFLQPYFRGFVLEFPIDELPTASDLKAMLKPTPWEAKLRSVGFEAVRGAQSVGRLPEAAARIVAVAEELGTRSFIYDVEDRQTVDRCRQIGLRNVSFLHDFPPVARPGKVEKVHLPGDTKADDPANMRSQR